MGFDVLVLDEEGLDDWVADRRADGDVVGVIDGRRAADEPSFHEGIGSALDFGDWGRNWDAVDDRLYDIDDGRTVLVLRDARWVLDDEPQERLRILADVLGAATSGEVGPDDRSGRGRPRLRVVLHAHDEHDADVLRRRFEAAGADLG
jgi:hypothetical protein